MNKHLGWRLTGSLLHALHASCVLVTFKLLFHYFVAPKMLFDNKAVLPCLGQGVTLCVWHKGEKTELLQHLHKHTALLGCEM